MTEHLTDPESDGIDSPATGSPARVLAMLRQIERDPAAFARLGFANLDALAQSLNCRDFAALEAAGRRYEVMEGAAKSLTAFTRYLDPDLKPARHLDRMASLLPTGRGQGVRLLTTFPPRWGKSELGTVALTAWLFGRDPRIQLILLCANQDLADGFGAKVKGIMEGEGFAEIFPDVKLSRDERSKAEFTTSKGGRFIARGPEGLIVGRGADVLILDDLIRNRAEADSPAERARLLAFFHGVASTRLMPGGSIIATGTRWHEDDLLGHLLDSGVYTHLGVPAIRFDAAGEEVSTWPEQWPLAELQAKRAEMPPREWHAQYLGKPRAEGGAFFLREWFTTYDRLPPGLTCYLATDLAYTQSTSSDFTVAVVFGMNREREIFILDVWRAQAVLSVSSRNIAALVSRYDVKAIFLEADPGTRANVPMLKERLLAEQCYRPIRLLSAAGDKSTRCRITQGLFELRRIAFPRGAHWLTAVEDELLGFPAARHDDIADAFGILGRSLGLLQGTTPPPVEEATYTLVGSGSLGVADHTVSLPKDLDLWREHGAGPAVTHEGVGYFAIPEIGARPGAYRRGTPRTG